MQEQISNVSWFYCLGCGAWQNVKHHCQQCGSACIVPAQDIGKIDARIGTKIDGSAIRVLIDIELRSDGTFCVNRLHTDRLVSIRHDTSLLRMLDNVLQTNLKSLPDDTSKWITLHAAARAHIVETIDRLLRPSYPGKVQRSQLPVEVRFRLFNLNPTLQYAFQEFPQLEIVTLDAAVATAAEMLQLDNVEVDLRGSILCLDDGGDQLRLDLRPPIEARVVKVVLNPHNEPNIVLAKFDSSAFLARNRLNPVLDARLPATALWYLSPKEKTGKRDTAELRAYFHGLDAKPMRVELPCGELGLRSSLVDVFLDIGSTTTKYVIREGDNLLSPQVKRTAKLADEWSLPRYDKAKLLNDSTGAAWAGWVIQLLTALRSYVARKHRSYLRNIYLTIPQSGRLNVAALASSLTKNTSFQQNGLDPDAIRTLVNRADFETVSSASEGQILVLLPEHEALARHYLAPLKVLSQTASSYLQFHQKELQKEQNRQRAQEEYDSHSFVWKFFHARPAGLTGPDPNVFSEISSPAKWMRFLADHPELFDRVVLLDAGGLSLDIAVLDSNELVADLSKSDANCGGERVTDELAKGLGLETITSEDGTREKARLGSQWTSNTSTSSLPLDDRFGWSGGKPQKTYREATRTVYSAAVTELANAIAVRWKKSHSARCTVLLTGGGSRNPHFQELVAEGFAKSGLEVYVIDAHRLQDLLNKARSFEYPLPVLTSPSVNLFSTVYGWALGEIRGSDLVAYDKYAVLGGLLAGARRP